VGYIVGLLTHTLTTVIRLASHDFKSNN